jgi:two-component system chemotaxis sensor kinase CheA
MAKDPYKYFRVEAREIAEQLGAGLLALERGAVPAEAVTRLLRLTHTLKGAARVVKQGEIADLAHRIEGALVPFREGREPVPADRLEAVRAPLREIGARVDALDVPAPSGRPDAPKGPEPFRTLRADVAEMDLLLDGLGEAQSRLAALRKSALALSQARRLAVLVGEQVAALQARAGLGGPPTGPTERAARDLRVLIGGVERALQDDVERVDRELAQVRGLGERLRLVPVDSLFGAFELLVAESARVLGKRARFEGRGGEVRLDGHVLGAVQSALVQVVRNAVAHGIEPPAERRRRGKPEEGTVVIEVSRRGPRVAFTCRDDGRGLDVAAVRTALARSGRLPPGEAGHDPDRLAALLFEGGVSTAGVVTEVSGRGVGLDVVREVAARLGGEVSLRARSGEGARLELVVPVSLSSVEGLVVEAGGRAAAVPMASVRETLRVDRAAIASSAEGEAIPYGGEMVPFMPLGRVLAREAGADGARHRLSAVVVAAGGRLAALGVDRLRGHATLLVRPIPALAPLGGVALGAFLDAHGDPQVVFDPEALVEAARRPRRETTRPPAPRAPILVVDDSLTTRRLEQSILESAGYAVDLASSGEEALEKARRRRYSLLLVDVEMPGMDGFTVLEHLRADPDLRGVPAVLVTSRDAPEDRARGARAGARAYIVKGRFDQAELLEQIRGLVG